MAKERPANRRSGGRAPADLYAAYLAAGPESNPRILLPRSALPLARGGFLLHGVLAQGWSVAWLVGFFAAEFFLVVRLAVLGDRFSGGPPIDPEQHRRRSLGVQLVWLAIALATMLFAGQGLDRSTRGAWFGFGDAQSLLGALNWGVIAYLALLIGEFTADLAAARRAKRTFASATVLQATFFLVAAVLLAFVGIVLVGLAHEGFGDSGARAMFAVLLVVARATADLAALWFPLWGPGRLTPKPVPPPLSVGGDPAGGY